MRAETSSEPVEGFTLDVVVPTYNRCVSLRQTILSVLNARRPSHVEINLYIVDNNSTDRTAEVIHSFGGNVHYVHESRQGRAPALNAGIKAGTGEVLAFVDDDEEVREDWLSVISEWMAKPEIHFIGGSYRAYKNLKIPAWFSPTRCGVIGITPEIEGAIKFQMGGGPMLLGGNSVIRRSVLDRIGLYNTRLGRTDKNLLSCEDEDLFLRLLDAGLDGYYVPDLVIFHFVPLERLTRRYFRRWSFWRAVSQAALAEMRPASVPRLLGVPRWMFNACMRDIPKWVAFWNPRESFSAELGWWDLAGWIYGVYSRTKSDLQA